jgi:preprotein translocase subunit SecB
MIEVNTTLKFEDKELNEKRSYFEIVYVSIIKINETVEGKEDLEKIILCDVQNKIYPNLEKTFLNLLHNSGFPEVSLDKKIDFTNLYKQRSN